MSNGWSMHYETLGDRSNPPLFMLSGYSHRIPHWGPVAQGLADRLFLILLDCRGMGESDQRDEPFSIEDEVGDIGAILDALDVQSTHVLGFSRGGFLAQELALSSPERVLSLILCGTGHRGPDSVGSSEEFRNATQYTRGQSIEDFYRNMIHTMGAPGWGERDPDALERCLAVDVEAPPGRVGLRGQQGAMPAWTSHERLHTIACPTLVLAGAEDRVMPPENGRQLNELIPNSTLNLIAGCGHLPMWEQPDLIISAVLDFISSLTGRED